MIKKSSILAAVAAVTAGTLALSTPANAAREGSQRSIGHGVKCYTVLGVRVCFKGP